VSRRALAARPIQFEDHAEWDRLAIRHGCLFDSTRWTQLHEPTIRRIGIFDSGSNLRGGFCVWEQRKFGLRILRNPPFTPHIGPFFDYRASNPAAQSGEQRAVAEAMAAWMAQDNAAITFAGLGVGHRDCLPFYWRGYKVIPAYTYRIDLDQTIDDLLGNFSPDRRKAIRKAQKDAIEVQPFDRTDDLPRLVGASFDRHRKRISSSHISRILEEFAPNSGGYGIQATDKGKVVAGVYVVYDTKTAYYLLGGYTDGAHHGAGALAMWHAITKAKNLGLQVFDFEGSVVPPIERYFRGFGGKLTPYFSVHKAWLPLEIGLKAFSHYRNRF